MAVLGRERDKLVDTLWQRKPHVAVIAKPAMIAGSQGTSVRRRPPIQSTIAPSMSGVRPKRATARPVSGVIAEPPR